jgi:hypothetical protein
MWKILFLLSFDIQALDCAKEVEKLCTDSKEFSKCLKQSVKKLPDECQGKSTGLNEAVIETAKTCLDEVLEICPLKEGELEGDLKANSKKKLACLKKNKKKFSKECRDFVSTMINN